MTLSVKATSVPTPLGTSADYAAVLAALNAKYAAKDGGTK